MKNSASPATRTAPRKRANGQRAAPRRHARPRPRPQPLRPSLPPTPPDWVCDLGNSNLRFARIQGSAVRPLLTLPANQPQMLRKIGQVVPERERGGTCYISSVRPGADDALRAALAACGLRALFVHPARHHIIDHRLETPESTGSDRLLAAKAAVDRMELAARETGQPFRGVAILLAGTALVADWVDARRIFRGGFIFPGPSMALGALAGAALLPSLAPDPDEILDETVGPDTRAAMQRGVALGLRGAAREAVAAIGRQAGRADLPVMVDGGWARELATAFSEAVVSPLLVLEGLRLWAAEPENKSAIP